MIIIIGIITITFGMIVGGMIVVTPMVYDHPASTDLPGDRRRPRKNGV